MQVTPSGALQAKLVFASRPDAEQPASERGCSQE